MALDTTIGGASADSYSTVVEADTYHSLMGNAAWALLADAVKESSLRVAAQYIDTTYQFIGDKYTATQALEWPRGNVVVDDFAIAVDVIPVQIKSAQIEAALRASTATLVPDVAGGSVAEKTVDVITVKYSEYTNNGQKKYPAIDRLLRKFIAYGLNSHRVIRA